jgi:hypothetical protein
VLFSICTNDSNTDTLAVDHMYQSSAGPRSTALPFPRLGERRARPRATVLVSACGATRWVEGLLFAMLRFGLVVSELSLPRQKSPAALRPISRIRFEEPRAFGPQLLRFMTAQNVVNRFPIAVCEVALERHGWFERAFFDVRPRGH